MKAAYMDVCRLFKSLLSTIPSMGRGFNDYLCRPAECLRAFTRPSTLRPGFFLKIRSYHNIYHEWRHA